MSNRRYAMELRYVFHLEPQLKAVEEYFTRFQTREITDFRDFEFFSDRVLGPIYHLCNLAKKINDPLLPRLLALAGQIDAFHGTLVDKVLGIVKGRFESIEQEMARVESAADVSRAIDHIKYFRRDLKEIHVDIETALTPLETRAKEDYVIKSAKWIIQYGTERLEIHNLESIVEELELPYEKVFPQVHDAALKQDLAAFWQRFRDQESQVTIEVNGYLLYTAHANVILRLQDLLHRTIPKIKRGDPYDEKREKFYSTQVGFVMGFYSIEELWLNHCGISDIEQIWTLPPEFPSLRLFVSNNHIQNIPPPPERLNTLDVSYNPIVTLQLDQCKELRLIVDKNQQQKFAGLLAKYEQNLNIHLFVIEEE